MHNIFSYFKKRPPDRLINGLEDIKEGGKMVFHLQQQTLSVVVVVLMG